MTKVLEKPRELEVIGEYEVIVAGGGLGGFPARCLKRSEITYEP